MKTSWYKSIVIFALMAVALIAYADQQVVGKTV
jgi:hypothetical protein